LAQVWLCVRPGNPPGEWHAAMALNTSPKCFPSPRLQAGALGVLNMKAGTFMKVGSLEHEPPNQVGDGVVRKASLQTVETCYTTRLQKQAQTSSPPARLPLTACNLAKLEGSPGNRRSNKTVGEPMAQKITAPIDVVAGRNPSASAGGSLKLTLHGKEFSDADGLARLMHTHGTTDLRTTEGAVASPRQGHSTVASRAFDFPSSTLIEDRVRKVCDASLDSIRPQFNMGNGHSLCRGDFQTAIEGMEELDAVLADRRHRQYKQARQEQREQVVAWKLKRQMKEKVDLERLRRKQEADEEQRRKEGAVSEVLNREQLREKKKANFRNILAKDKNAPKSSKIAEGDDVEADELGSTPTATLSLGAMKKKREEELNQEALGRARTLSQMSETKDAPVETPTGRYGVNEDTQLLERRAASKTEKGHSRDQLLDKLRKAYSERVAAERMAAEEDDRRGLFDALDENERLALENAFHLHERTGLGLDSEGLLKALRELGFQGMTTEEWAQCVSICKKTQPKKKNMVEGGLMQANGTEAENTNPGCMFYKFAVGVVTEVRTALRECRKTRVQLCLCNVKREWDTGKLSFDSLLEAVLPIFPLEGDTVEPNEDLEKVKMHINAYIPDENKILDLVTNLENISRCRQQKVSEAQQQVRKEIGVNLQLFERFRPQLLVLRNIFQNLNAVSSGHVGAIELLIIFDELDVIPSHAEHDLRSMAELKVHSSAPVNFNGFLKLIAEISEMMEPVMEQKVHHIKRFFENHQIDSQYGASPHVNQEVLEVIFEEAGMKCEEPEVRSVMRRVNSMAGMDGKGHLSIETVKRLYRSTMERVRQREVLHKYVSALRMNFNINEMREFHKIFGTLDADDSGMLDGEEVREACDLMKLDLGKPAYFDVAFSILDEDGGGGLDFLEFMKFLKMVHDKDGPFKDASATPVTTIRALDRMDLVLLLECYDGRNQAEDMAMSVEDLRKDASTVLQVGLSISLAAAFGVRTLEDLLDHARNSRNRNQ